jgi:hypothetical protein
VTEAERIDREALLRRAAAAAGAVYLAPALTSIAAAKVEATCSGQQCGTAAADGTCMPSRKGRRQCRAEGGPGCRCRPTGSGICACQQLEAACTPDSRCHPGPPCDVVQFCNRTQTCACFILIPGDGIAVDCVNFLSNFCADYTPCDIETGEGCPRGMCCLSTCCPGGVCTSPCGTGPPPLTARAIGSGPTLTL